MQTLLQDLRYSLRTLLPQIYHTFPLQTPDAWEKHVRLLSLHESMVGDVRPILLVLLGFAQK